MAQIKIYGLAHRLNPVREELSRVIHACVVDALELPVDKRAHRFFAMSAEDMLLPGGRTEAYTIIEIAMMTGRTVETKKKLVRLLFDRIRDEIGIAHQDVEICIFEAPAHAWGFRGEHGDEVALSYRLDV
jgi:phenylpyruvate tautomerase PptA (4-oxalocrotonate tautomerase family)